MSAMTHARLGSEFDRFLYASIGDDHNGMPLTVLSALARLDVDPWEEASKLTQLPEKSAVSQLASRLGSLRDAHLAYPDPAGVAAPLIALLPRQHDLASPVLRVLARATPTRHPTAFSIVLSVFAYMIIVLFSNWLMGSFQSPGPVQPPAALDVAADSPNRPSSGEVP
jgi:hypothetical protein